MLSQPSNADLSISTYSACSSKLKKAEKTILAVTQDEERANSSIRISLSHLTTQDEVSCLLKAIKEIK